MLMKKLLNLKLNNNIKLVHLLQIFNQLKKVKLVHKGEIYRIQNLRNF